MSNAKRVAFPALFVALFALALAPALVSPGHAVAQASPQQANFFGTGLQGGDEVAALIDGVVCGTHTVAAEDGGGWIITIKAGSCGGGAVEGARVTFTLNGNTADQWATWSDGYFPSDRVNGIVLTAGSGGPSVPVDPTGATLSRTQGLAIFSGGSLDELEAVVLAACPGGALVWANEPSGNGYLSFVPNPAIAILNAAFRSHYPDGFDGPEPVIVEQCTR